MEDGGRCLHSDRPPAKLLKCMRTKREHQVNGQESYRAHPFDHMEARTLAQQCVRERGNQRLRRMAEHQAPLRE